jgi:DNA-binding NarL/FixJ family response regulator
MTRILIADDHDVVRSGLRLILEAHAGWEIVAEAADGKDAVSKALETRPDVAVLDYSIPLMNGVEATRQIRKRAPSTEVLIFTMIDNDALVGEVLEAGAKAYLLKSDAKQHLIAAVEALSHHKPYFSDQISEKLLETFLLTQKGHPRAALSARERIVVQLIAEGHSNKEMSGILNLSIKTIESHRASAMRKLNITSAAGLVRYAIRNRLIEA